MTGAEVELVLLSLRRSRQELADEFGVSERTVRRWTDDGVDGVPAAAFRYAQRLHACGLAWRRNEVTVRVREGGVIVVMRDVDVAERLM